MFRNTDEEINKELQNFEIDLQALLHYEPKKHAENLTCSDIIGKIKQYEIHLELLDEQESTLDPQRFIKPMKTVNRIVNVIPENIFYFDESPRLLVESLFFNVN